MKTLSILIQMAKCLEKQFGTNCEIVIHDLTTNNPEHTIAYIGNGNVTGRHTGGASSKIVLEAFNANNSGKTLKNNLGYLTNTPDGRILKSSTMYIKDTKTNKINYIFAINYDITGFISCESAIKNLTKVGGQSKKKPETILCTVNDLLDSLIAESVEMIGKPAMVMSRDEKKKAIEYLNESGAFLITKSSEKIADYFGISKFTLYNYIDVNKNHKSKKEDDE